MSATALQIAIGCAAASAVTAMVLLWLGRRRQRWRGRRGALRGHAAQREAASLLREQGYQVRAEEQQLGGQLEVDGERVDYDVRVDYVVARGGRTYAVEVKSGKASSPRSAQTRRQLREYAALADVDGLLLVDMQRRRVHELRFVEAAGVAPRRARATSIALSLLLGLCLGALAVLLFVGFDRGW
jgi:Holliday junction resolvase